MPLDCGEVEERVSPDDAAPTVSTSPTPYLAILGPHTSRGLLSSQSQSHHRAGRLRGKPHAPGCRPLRVELSGWPTRGRDRVQDDRDAGRDPRGPIPALIGGLAAASTRGDPGRRTHMEAGITTGAGNRQPAGADHRGQRGHHREPAHGVRDRGTRGRRGHRRSGGIELARSAQAQRLGGRSGSS